MNDKYELDLDDVIDNPIELIVYELFSTEPNHFDGYFKNKFMPPIIESVISVENFNIYQAIFNKKLSDLVSLGLVKSYTELKFYIDDENPSSLTMEFTILYNDKNIRVVAKDYKDYKVEVI